MCGIWMSGIAELTTSLQLMAIALCAATAAQVSNGLGRTVGATSDSETRNFYLVRAIALVIALAT